MTLVNLHDVIAIALGPIKYHPPSVDCDHAFWTRAIILSHAHGADHAIHIFAHEPAHLEVTAMPPPPCRLVTIPGVTTPEPLSQAA
jgi:hypothetical protein